MLVHSPAVGPSTWRWVAAALVDRGHDVVVPDLRAAVVAGDPEGFVAAATRSCRSGSDPGRQVAVVGHSGAGPLLPAIARAAADGPATAGVPLVFVDAGLPAEGPDPFLDRLRALAGEDGLLPPWSTWFGPDAMALLVPDPTARSAVEGDEPRAPLAFYEARRPAVRLPSAAGYLLLSEAYRPEADRAAGLGWRVGEVPSTHLGLVTHAQAVAEAVLRLLR